MTKRNGRPEQKARPATTSGVTERGRTEDALRENEVVLRATLEATADGILVVDNSSRVLHANARFAEMWHVPKKLLEAGDAEKLRRAVADQLEDPEAFLSGLRELYETPQETLDALSFRDGRVFERLSRPLMREGKVAGRVWSFRDVTERKRAEEALRLQSEILQHMTEAVYLIRAGDGVIVYTNPSFERLFGYGPGEMIGAHVSVVNAPTDKSPEETAKEIMAALERTGVWRGEILNIKKDGTPFWCDANVSTFDHPAHGRVWVTYHTDITERKRAEEALRESEERYRSLYTKTPAMLHSIDTDGHVVAVNDRWLEVLGYERSEVIGRKSVEFLTDASREYAETVSLPRFWEVGSVRDVPYQFVKRNGELVDILLSAVVERDDTGRVLRTIAGLTDVTERNRLEEALQRARETLEGKVEREMLQDNPYGLTFREFTVLHLVAAGRADKEIARELSISPLTVHKHVANILGKMSAASRTEAGVRALREGLLD